MICESRIRSASVFMMTVALFTVIGVVIQLFGGTVYFSLSLFTPFFALVTAMQSGGAFIALAIAVAVVMTALTGLLSWLGRKHVSALIAGLVILALDLLFYLILMGPNLSTLIFDLLLRGLTVLYVSLGIGAHFKLKKLYKEQKEAEAEFTAATDKAEDTPKDDKDVFTPAEIEEETLPLYDASAVGEQRLFAEHGGESVAVYRKFGVTELAVSGKVYARYDGISEASYRLSCRVNGTVYEYLHSDNEAVLGIDGNVISRTKV